MRISKTRFHSWKAGSLSDGCKQCVRGEKLVLFVTGLCSARCKFCPVSDKKLYKDVIYANERPILHDKSIIEEAIMSKSTGAGVTGGDPLVTWKRTVKYIKMLKKRFGAKFHIHLYTPLRLVSDQKLRALHNAGLDEIRLHPDLYMIGDWAKILMARKYDWKLGIEIPVVPGSESRAKELIDYVKGKVDFLNFNELEVADNEVWRKVDFKCKNNSSYAVAGSEELAKKLLRYAAAKGICTHYCTCKLKDRVQLAKRVRRRASQARLPTDKVDAQGMLYRGAIYLPNLTPGFGYRRKLEGLERSKKSKMLKKLNQLRQVLAKQNIESHLDQSKVRLLLKASNVKEIRLKEFVRALVTEYPTHDALELEVEIL